jgi:hypothetical protein
MHRSVLILVAALFCAGIGMLSPAPAAAAIGDCEKCQVCHPPLNEDFAQCCIISTNSCGSSKYCTTQISAVSDCLASGDLCTGHTACTSGGSGGGSGGGGGGGCGASAGFCPAECFGCGPVYY